jgi:hypothetical protein
VSRTFQQSGLQGARRQMAILSNHTEIVSVRFSFSSKGNTQLEKAPLRRHVKFGAYFSSLCKRKVSHGTRRSHSSVTGR